MTHLIFLAAGLFIGAFATWAIMDLRGPLEERLILYTDLDQPFECSIERYQAGTWWFVEAKWVATGRTELIVQQPTPELAEEVFFRKIRERGGAKYFPGKR